MTRIKQSVQPESSMLKRNFGSSLLLNFKEAHLIWRRVLSEEKT
jgi:hypothetical protein